MRSLRSQRAALRPLVFGIIAIGTSFAWLGGSAAEDEPQTDGVLPGTVAFFGSDTASCPDGWAQADYAMGRLVVGVTDTLAVGKLVGKPLADQEDRTHSHGFATAVDLPYKSIAAADGANNEGARAEMVPVAGTTDPSPSGLPFIQLLVCEKQ